MPLHRPVAALAAAALIAGGLTACSSSDAAAACPTAAPASDAPTAWQFSGTTGSIAVVAPTDSTGPKVTVTPVFAVDRTTVQTLNAGDGAVVGDTANVSVCYLGVNGRTGQTFDSSYQRGKPAPFAVTEVIAGFTKALVGQKVGSTVAVAIAPSDGYVTGNPAAGIEASDTLVFVLKIRSAS